MSSFAERVRRWYEAGIWTAQMVRNAHAKGRITDVELAEILGGDAEADAPDLQSMTKHELLLYAQSRGITVYESWTKDRIVAAVRAALGVG